MILFIVDIVIFVKINVNFYGSVLLLVYLMGLFYEDWFIVWFGFFIRLVYIGDGKRVVLGDIFFFKKY